MMSFAAGTTEAEWRRWLEPQDWPAFDPGAPGRMLVLAAHADDAILGVGGLMALMDAAGWEIEIVTVTDGEICHPGRQDIAREGPGRDRDEHTDALAALGLGQVKMRHLGFTDGATAGMIDLLVERLEPLADGADWCLAPSELDAHTDHVAVEIAAAEICRRQGVRLARYPVWAWHVVRPADGAVDVQAARCVDLPRGVQEAKAAALETFSSSLGTPGGMGSEDRLLEHFRRPYEVLFV